MKRRRRIRATSRARSRCWRGASRSAPGGLGSPHPLQAFSLVMENTRLSSITAGGRARCRAKLGSSRCVDEAFGHARRPATSPRTTTIFGPGFQFGQYLALFVVGFRCGRPGPRARRRGPPAIGRTTRPRNPPRTAGDDVPRPPRAHHRVCCLPEIKSGVATAARRSGVAPPPARSRRHHRGGAVRR